MIAVLKPGDSLILSPGMSTPCIAPFQPFWFDAYSREQVFDYGNQNAAMDAWLRRERINRAILEGRLPVEEYRAQMHAMERAWIEQAAQIARADRQAFVDANAAQANAFIDKWIAVAERAPHNPRGTEGFRLWWARQNAQLGKDRRLAL